jgi:subtilase family serine protease
MARRTLGLVALALAVASGVLAPTSSAAPSPVGVAERNIPVCSAPAGGDAECHAIRHDTTTGNGRVAPNTAPAGYGPTELQSAYATATAAAAGGGGQTVAIVDAYDDPKAEPDLAVYRSQYGLAPCSTANGCFRKVNQRGGTRYPKTNGGWAQEISLDLDMVSAVCPACHILLVEADSSSLTNLGAAVNEAATLGATVISNSYGGPESTSDTSYDTSYYNHPGVAITVSSGDSGYGVQYPAASQYVTAVGGTTLTRATTTTRGWSETAWSGAGSGCSAYDPKPKWQNDTGCSRRTVADVAAVADPNTGVSVYDSYTYQGTSGWLVFGGTSVAAPLIGAVYALAGNTTTLTYGSYPYTHPTGLFDVTTGSNGTCSPTYLCTGTPGYDGPTGLGTPNGTTAY